MTTRTRRRRFVRSHWGTISVLEPILDSLPQLSTNNPVSGGAITVSTGQWIGATPSTFEYFWERSIGGAAFVAIAATSATYTVDAGGADAGYVLRGSVIAITADGHRSARAYSSPSLAVVASVAVPVIVNPPTLSNYSPGNGEVVTASHCSYFGDPIINFHGQWYDNGVAISGQTALTHTAITGERLKYGERPENAGGLAAAEVRSVETAAVSATPPAVQVPGYSFVPTEYVTLVARPSTLAAGLLSGAIPANYVSMETGNAGGAFATVEACIDAANTADAHPVFGKDNLPSTYTRVGGTKKYVKRYWIGIGSANPIINYTWPSNVRAACNFAYVHDIGSRWMDHLNGGICFSVTQPGNPLIKDGALHPWPFHSSGDDVFAKTNSRETDPNFTGSTVYNRGIAADFKCQKNFTITPVAGSYNCTRLYGRRQIYGTTFNQSPSLNLEPYLENIELISGTITNVTPTKVRDAINAFTATSGFTAILSDDGLSVIGLRSTLGYLLSIHAECSGGFTFAMPATAMWDNTDANNTWASGVRIEFGQLDTCNAGFSFLLDAVAAGPINFTQMELYRTWGAGNAYAGRWSKCFAYYKHEHCKQSEVNAVPRLFASRFTNAQPSGGGTNIYNMSLTMGTSPAWYFSLACTVHKVLNCEWNDIQSLNRTDTNDCAGAVSFKQGYDRMLIGGVRGGHSKHGWFLGTDCYGIDSTAAPAGSDAPIDPATGQVKFSGAVDGNIEYGNSKGFTQFPCVWVRCGTGWFNTQFFGTEAGMVNKEGGFASPDTTETRIGFTYIDGPMGCPAVKIDKHSRQVNRYFHVKNLDNRRGYTGTYPNHTFIVPSNFYDTYMVGIAGNATSWINEDWMLENVNDRGIGWLISLYRVIPQDLVPSAFVLRGIRAKVPSGTGDRVGIKCEIFGGAIPGYTLTNFFNAITFEDCYFEDLNGNVTGKMQMLVTNNGMTVTPAVVGRPNFRGNSQTTGLPIFA